MQEAVCGTVSNLDHVDAALNDLLASNDHLCMRLIKHDHFMLTPDVVALQSWNHSGSCPGTVPGWAVHLERQCWGIQPSQRRMGEMISLQCQDQRSRRHRCFSKLGHELNSSFHSGSVAEHNCPRVARFYSNRPRHCLDVLSRDVKINVRHIYYFRFLFWGGFFVPLFVLT